MEGETDYNEEFEFSGVKKKKDRIRGGKAHTLRKA